MKAKTFSIVFWFLTASLILLAIGFDIRTILSCVAVLFFFIVIFVVRKE